MQIWVYLNGVQQGPYTLAQVKELGLEPSTPVWYEGLADWTAASEAEATAMLFAAQPDATPEFARAANTTTMRNHAPKPPTYLVWNILMTVLCCSLPALVGIITGSVSSSRFAAGDYEGARRMSEVTQWMVIISVVWILLSLPVTMVLSLI